MAPEADMKLTCPTCEQTITTPREAAGHVVRCECGQKIAVPISSGPSDAPGGASDGPPLVVEYDGSAPPPLPSRTGKSRRAIPLARPLRARTSSPLHMVGIDWGGAGALGKTALVVGPVGLAIAGLGALVWLSGAGSLDHTGWQLYPHRGEPLLPYVYQAAYQRLDAGKFVLGFGVAATLMAVLVAWVNAVSTDAPRSTARPLQVAGACLIAALCGFVLCSPALFQG